MHIEIPKLIHLCRQVLLQHGVSADHASSTSESLVLTDSWGIHTHGTKNLRGYIRRIKGGGINGSARPCPLSEGPAWVMIDGDNALGMVASEFAMRAAMGKAAECGIGFAGLKGSCHFGAAGVYSNLAAQSGFIGLSMTNDTPTVAAPASRGPVLGSNPFSYAIPVQGANPLLFDIATSTVAGGKVFQAAARNQAIPEGWIIDSTGAPTTDPALFPDHATLTPFAAHKGYGLALLIEILSAVITGAGIAHAIPSWSFSDPSIHTNHGGAFIAISVEKLMNPASFQNRLQGFIEEIRAQPAVPEGRILLPGEMEWARRQKALDTYLELPPETAHSLQMLFAESNLSME